MGTLSIQLAEPTDQRRGKLSRSQIMIKPRYTDTHKRPHGYTTAAATDVSKTFARVRREMAEQAKREAEAVKNVKPIKRKA